MFVSRAAFTLVELSIVLVILGLLVGGVLTGQSLILAAELRSITTQYNQYTTALNAFRDKYFALPGDMTNAASFWSGTVNGNGDGWYNLCDSPPERETFQGFKELALAGLIEGSYTGTATTSTSNPCHAIAVARTNVPAGKISNSGWFMVMLNQNSSVNYEVGYSDLSAAYYNWFIFGGIWSDGLPIVPNLKPEEAWNLDTKIDDGKPGTGKIRAGNGAGGGTSACQSSSTSTSVYNLNLTTALCYLGFQM